MEWSERQILDTLKLIEASDYDEVRLETGNFKLHVRKSGAPAAPLQIQALPPVAPARAALERAPAETAMPAVTPDAAPAGQGDAVVPEGMVAIRAPMIGTFYRAPAPHLAPFVEVGARVEPDDSVCLIEVMKLFNTIKAGVSGTVTKIIAQNAATIKRDQVLMLIVPD